MLAKSSLLFFLFAGFGSFLRYSESSPVFDVDSDMKMLKDIGRNLPDKCFTPPNLEDIFMRSCEQILDDTGKCSFGWTAFTLAFRFKDPSTVEQGDYKIFFDILKVKSPLYSTVFWSGVEGVIKEISVHPKISSSANRVTSSIINTMATDYNVMCWCGNATAVLDTANPCPIAPVAAFWQDFASRFGKAGAGIVYWIGDGNREGGAYQNTSLFSQIEFPKLTYPRVYRMVIMVIHECNETMVEGCGEGTLQTLEDNASQQYGNTGYRCENVCGNASDEQQIPLLAEQFMQIITEEQKRVATINFSQSLYVVNERNGVVNPVLILSNKSSTDLTVQVVVTDFSASRGTDYYSSALYNVTFPAGVTNISLSIRIRNDGYFESDEIFFLTIIGNLLPNNVTLGNVTGATVVIENADIGVNFNQSRYIVEENNREMQAVLVLSKPSSTNISISVMINDYNSATRGTDYYIGTYNVTFAAGETSASINILIADDNILEPNESFGLYIDSRSLPSGVIRISPHSVIVTIINDDYATIDFNQLTYYVNENNGSVIPVLVLSAPSSSDFTVRVTDVSFTATRGRYYTSISGYDYRYGPYFVRFPAGKTRVPFSVTIYDDTTTVEYNETFHLHIYSGSLPALVSIGSNNSATVVILDDEIGISFDYSRYTINENTGLLQPVLILSRPLSVDFTVKLLDVISTASRGVDYYIATYNVTIPAGETRVPLIILISDDDAVEGNEAFGLSIDAITLPSGAKRVSPYSFTVVIWDDDYTIVSFNQATYSIDESSGAVQPMLVLSTSSSNDFTVEVRDTALTATRGPYYRSYYSYDYRYGPYYVTIPAGVTRVPFSFLVFNDARIESNEVFYLDIYAASLPTYVHIGSVNRATVTIVDNDFYVSFNQSSYTVTETSQQLQATLVLSKPLSTDVTIQILDSVSSAIRYVDYYPGPYNVTFKAGETTASVNVSIFDNDVIGGNKAFRLYIDSSTLPSGGNRYSPYSVTVTIQNDDYTTISFNQSTYYVNENHGAVQFVLSLSIPLSFALTLQVTDSAISATRGRYYSRYYDYRYGPYSIRIPAGENNISYSVAIFDDTRVENNEAFRLYIYNAPEYIIIDNSAIVIIVDNDFYVNFGRSSYTVTETSQQLKATLVLSKPLSTDVTIQVLDSVSSAIRNVDYYPGPYNVTFPAGETTVSFSISITDDDVIGGNKVFILTIDSSTLPSGGIRTSPYSVTVTIQNNDFATVMFNQATYVVDENNGPVKPVLVLSNPLSTDLTVRITENSGTASRGTYSYYDYYRGSYSARIPAGMTNVSFSIVIFDDSKRESNEYFYIYIYSNTLSSYVSSGSINQARVTIIDNDYSTISFSEKTYSCSEHEKQSQPVLVLNKPLLSSEVVQIMNFSVTATGGYDYYRPSNVLIPAGVTNISFTVPIIDDNKTESNETFILTIKQSSLSNHLAYGRYGATTVTIIDDDSITVSFEQSTYAVNEHNQTVQPVLVLNKPLPYEVTIEVSTFDESATGGNKHHQYESFYTSLDFSNITDTDTEDGSADYVTGPYYVTFAAGVTRSSLSILVINDNLLEGNESFMLNINPSSLSKGLTIGDPSQVRVTVFDDESSMCTVTGDIKYNENNKTMVFNFLSNNTDATYLCKLDKDNFINCTSPMIWRKLSKGLHTVTVKFDCIINGVPASTTKRKFTFTVE